MAQNIQRSRGRSNAYKIDRGGAPAETGPFIGEVMNNNDPTRSGRVQVYITDFAGPNRDDQSLWRTVNYISPFYGTTQQTGTSDGVGEFAGNSHSYGFWSTPPDIGTKVICFFASGDPNQGYYLGSEISPGKNHMVPAIGASSDFPDSLRNGYFQNSTQLPVVEINDDDEAISENTRFFDETKPLHGYVASVMLQQGVINDIIRGPINSNSQRESPSNVFGWSTPGKPIYAGGLSEADIQRRLEQGTVTPQEAKIIARRGGHSFVMDDGDLNGADQLVRIRTAKGHQIMLSDTGDSLHIMHANGQSWVELGAEGTIDMFATNSVNIRSQGELNFHADKGVNINSLTTVNINSERSLTLESKQTQLIGKDALLAYSEKYIGIKSDGTIGLQNVKTGSWDSGSTLTLSASCISLNGGKAPDVPSASKLIKQSLPDVVFEQNTGWVAQPNLIETVVTRAPTHEPFPYHGAGINTTTQLNASTTTDFNSTVNAKLDSIQNVEFTAISATNYEQQTQADINIGSISADQVTGMLAQSSTLVNQGSDTISNTLGVGKFGLSAQQLENGGYLKPGTTEFYLQDATATLTDVLQSPSVWTGADGVDSLSNFLNDEELQDKAKINLYQKSLDSLKQAGIATGQEEPAKLASLVEVGAKYDSSTVQNWIADTDLDSVFTSDMNQLARSSQYSVELASQKLNDGIRGRSTAVNIGTNTAGRADVDKAVVDIINNPKVPPPLFTSTFENTFTSRTPTFVSDTENVFSSGTENVFSSGTGNVFSSGTGNIFST